MIIRKPAYYTAFRCIAGACPDSCCKEWAVDIDEKSAAFYRSLPGALGDALRASLKETEDGTVLETDSDGRCPMWRADGLCRIQAELGEEALSCVCSTFPRLTHDYGTFREQQLELSCPAAAELILREKGSLVTEEADIPVEDPEYDPAAMGSLLRGRQELLDILENPAFSVPQALAAAIFYGYHMQDVLDGQTDDTFSAADAIASAQSVAEKADPGSILDFFGTLEILNPAWQARLDSLSDTPWEDCLRNAVIYFVQRYFLQSVSDLDVVCRVKFAVISCLVIHYLGGDPVQTAQQYSKEIENDPDNLNAILDACYFEPAFSDRHLISCLLA